jgi:hypothetical protein
VLTVLNHGQYASNTIFLVSTPTHPGEGGTALEERTLLDGGGTEWWASSEACEMKMNHGGSSLHSSAVAVACLHRPP